MNKIEKLEKIRKFHQEVFIFSPDWRWAVFLGPDQTFAWLLSGDREPNWFRRLMMNWLLGLIFIRRDKSLDPKIEIKITHVESGPVSVELPENEVIQ